MVEYKKAKCQCGNNGRTWVTWVNDQWLCVECLTEMATKIMELKKQLGREIEKLGIQVDDVKRAKQTVMRQNVVARLTGERSGLKFVLKILKGWNR